MDITKYIQNNTEAPKENMPRLSKEEYAAMKRQEREDAWMAVDTTAQSVFRDGNSLQSFLDFFAQCTPQKAVNLLLLYSQDPNIRHPKTYDKWREEKRVLKSGVHGYRFFVTQEYEKDGAIAQGYQLTRVYDMSQVRMAPPPTPEPKPMDVLMGALLSNNEVAIRVSDELPENVQAQYIPRHRAIYVRNGMSETTTFHSINRELSCAALDRHDGSYSRAAVSAQSYCAAYVVAKKYGVDVTGFKFEAVCQRQEHGNKDPKELRAFVNDIKNGAYTIERHINRNLGEPEQAFTADEFAVLESSANEKQARKSKAKAAPEI